MHSMEMKVDRRPSAVDRLFLFSKSSRALGSFFLAALVALAKKTFNSVALVGGRVVGTHFEHLYIETNNNRYDQV